MKPTLLRVKEDIHNPLYDPWHTSWETHRVIPAGTMLVLRVDDRIDKGQRWIGSAYGLGRDISAESQLGSLILAVAEITSPATIHDVIAINEAHNLDLTRILHHLIEEGTVSVEDMDAAFQDVIKNLRIHPRRPKGAAISM